METIEQLKAEREALAARMEQIDKLLAEYNAWSARAASLLPAIQRVTPVRDTMFAPKTEPAIPSPMRKFEDAVMAVLERAPSPLDRSKLLERVEALGIVVGGADPRNTISARLSRMPDVINVKGIGYWPKSKVEQNGKEQDRPNVMD